MRMKFRFLLINTSVAALIYFPAFFLLRKFWALDVYGELSGTNEILFFFLVLNCIFVSVIYCILPGAEKSKRQLFLHSSLITAMQAFWLICCLYVIAVVRPLAIVYEIDRFRAVGTIDIYPLERPQLPVWFTPWTLSEPRFLGIKSSFGIAELAESIELSEGGYEPSQRPSKWQDYKNSSEKISGKARKINEIYVIRPDVRNGIQTYLVKKNLIESQVNWLPVVGRKEDVALIALLGKDGGIIDVLNIDGFI